MSRVRHGSLEVRTSTARTIYLVVRSSYFYFSLKYMSDGYMSRQRDIIITTYGYFFAQESRMKKKALGSGST